MKKLFNVALLIGAVSALMCSCEQEPKTDGKAEFASFTITAEANPALELTRDYKAIINNTEGTILVALPEGTDVTALVPTFTLTKDDAASVDGVAIVSGEWTIDLTEPVVAKVEDAMSMVSKEYTITAAYTDGIAELTKVGFYAASNEGKLTTDVEPIAIASTMTVAFAGDANQTFVLTVEATMDDVVTVNGAQATLQEPAEGETATAFVWTAEADCSFPIDIVVADAKAGVENKYVIKIVKDTYGESWSKVASIAELPAVDYTMEIDPVTGDLYVAHTEATMKDGETSAVNRITVKKWDGSQFVAVGEPAFSPVKASKFSLAARNGKLYVAFSDNTKIPYAEGKTRSGRLTIMEYANGAWTMVGVQGEMGTTSGLSKNNSPLEIAPDNGHLVLATTPGEDFTDWGVTKSTFHVGVWNGQTWSHAGAVADRSATQASYLNRLAVAGKDLYLMCANQVEKTTSVYKYADGAWTTVVNEYKMDERVNEIATYFGTMKGRENGELYFALGEQVYGVGAWYLQLFKLAGNTLERVYAPIQDNQGSSASFDVEFDANGTPIVAYMSSKTSTTKLVTIDPDTQTWTWPADLGEGPYSGHLTFMQKTPAGEIYMTFVKQNQALDEETGKTVKTYEVVLYKKVK